MAEGKHDCDVAQALLHSWTRFLRGSDNETLQGLYRHLLYEQAQATSPEADGASVAPSASALRLDWVAGFVRRNCVLPFHMQSAATADVEEEIADHILEEISSVTAYVLSLIHISEPTRPY